MAADVLARMHHGQNRHDLEAFLACFHADYRSEQPVHPDRDFVGVDEVRTNWAEVFADVPDFRSDLVRSASSGDTGWAEWHWYGTRPDGSRLDLKGVTIFGSAMTASPGAGCTWTTSTRPAPASTAPWTR